MESGLQNLRISHPLTIRGARMADDPDVEWLTYDEAARRLGILPDSVRRRAASRKWPRRVGNDRLARVGIPRSIIPDGAPARIPDDPDDSGQLRADLAAAQARLEGLEARLADTQSERDRLADLLERALETRRSIWSRLFGS
jgi:hypothetical protein